MFPHTVTLFNVNKVNGEVSYSSKKLDGVFYYKTNKAIKEENGENNSSEYHCIIPKSVIDKTQASFKKNDLIVIGECNNITSIKELEDKEYFPIKSIIDSLYGSDELQNMEVTNCE